MNNFLEYVDSLPANHIEALLKICSDFSETHAKHTVKYNNNWKIYQNDEYQLLYQLAVRFIAIFEFDFPMRAENMSNNSIYNFFNEFGPNVNSYVAAEYFEQRYTPRSDAIRLNKSQSEDLQEKTNELRKIIVSAEYLSEKHRTRLLRRIEKFQLELHKTISDRDAFLAGWSEINDMIEETGSKSKQIVDRFREIVSAVNRTEPKQIGRQDQPKQITDQSEED